jgi:hypothetical protein
LIENLPNSEKCTKYKKVPRKEKIVQEEENEEQEDSENSLSLKDLEDETLLENSYLDYDEGNF